MMKAAKATGLAPGVGDADKQYWANSLVERLHDPAFDEGFTPSTDYRFDKLGAQGGDHGAKYIEGAAYCPGAPEPLRNATKTCRVGSSTDLLGSHQGTQSVPTASEREA
ncbi:hypothetical protein [Glaciibacter superstes]|uniref:hypothetical protein n=1 Tax=Glaciibacter superstes TaxID=501023 RepID=UPI0003B369F0|nr:hypothetical protein [Glaciibacter superstes]